MRTWEKWYWGIFSGLILLNLYVYLAGETKIYEVNGIAYTKNQMAIYGVIGWLIIALIPWAIIRLIVGESKKK